MFFIHNSLLNLGEITDILERDGNRSKRHYLTNLVRTKEDLDELYAFVKANDNARGSYASWVFTNVTDQKKERIVDYHNDLIEWLPNCKTNGILRSMIRSVAQYKAPEELETEWIDLCFQYLLKIDYEIAVKAHAMQVLHLYCKKYPELAPELKMVLEEGMELYSSGLKARGRNILKSLEKISQN